MVTRFYIAGKVSGEHYGKVVRKFDNAEKYIREVVGYGDLQVGRVVVFNPIDICDQNWCWLHCMLVCLQYVAVSKVVVLLPDWRDSRGARIEERFARLLHKTIWEITPEPQNGEALNEVKHRNLETIRNGVAIKT